MRYRLDFVLRNRAWPDTAGDAMNPSASWFSASFWKVRPVVERTTILPSSLKQ